MSQPLADFTAVPSANNLNDLYFSTQNKNASHNYGEFHKMSFDARCYFDAWRFIYRGGVVEEVKSMVEFPKEGAKVGFRGSGAEIPTEVSSNNSG